MEKNISFLKGIFGTMQNPDVNNSYMSDKRAIVNLFNNTKERTVDDIRLRLTVIDSMYSTQMNRRYYALDELAEKLSSFSKDDFVSFASQRPVKDSFKGLWSGRYGIGKDGKEKGIAVSLISKYAYFETGFQFPIYDSIACEMLPLVNSFCGFDKVNLNRSGDGYTIVKEFITAINNFQKNLEDVGINASYDQIDKLLWFVGKICRGNLSLILSREEYEKCIKVLSKFERKTDEYYLNIMDLSVEELRDIPLSDEFIMFFELAKKILPTREKVFLTALPESSLRDWVSKYKEIVDLNFEEKIEDIGKYEDKKHIVLLRYPIGKSIKVKSFRFSEDTAADIQKFLKDKKVKGKKAIILEVKTVVKYSLHNTATN